MDKETDAQIFYDFYQRLNSEVRLSCHRRVLLTRIIKLSASEPDVPYQIMGNELREAGEPQKSFLAFRRATVIEPENYSAQRDFANALFEIEKEKEGFDFIKKALSLNPQSYCFHQFLIEILEKRHRLEDLESFSKEILDMNADPKSIPIYYFTSGHLLVYFGKSPQALALYKKAIENNLPMGYHEHFNYGTAFYLEGLFENAIIQFKRTLEIAPNDKASLNSITHINYCLGNVQKAREEFEFLIANGLEMYFTDSNFLLVLYHLDESEEIINQYKNRLGQSMVTYGLVMPKVINEQLGVTQKILGRDDIDEKTREFNLKKLEGIKLVLSFINERNSALRYF